MDTLRGQFGSVDFDEAQEYGAYGDDDAGNEPPPSPVGQDERRMQVRAYNHWASQLTDRNFPSIEDLEPADLPDFGPYSVLLDFTGGIDDPAVRFVGATLAEECDIDTEIGQLSAVPARSLLSRITDHYMQILANQAPIGFEAEFVNQRGQTILYRGILLPYSSDNDTIDFILGVINWKEMADQATSDELLLEIDQALEAETAVNAERPRLPDPVTDWADGPGADDSVVDSASVVALRAEPATDADDPFPQPAFGAEDEDEEDDEASDLYEAIEAVDEPGSETRFASLLSLGGARSGRNPLDLGEADGFEEDFDDFDYEDQNAVLAAWQNPGGAASPAAVPHDYVAPEPEEEAGVTTFDEPFELVDEAASLEPVGSVALADSYAGDDQPVVATNDDELGIYDALAAARESALAASSCEDRSRSALYAAVGRAYDFSLAAQADPDAFAELIAESGLTVQERAPMTPVVKLVFGADYDKTRLTEYAAVLMHAHRHGIARGTLAYHLAGSEGGLKGVVQAEREWRKADGGEAVVRETPREALARKLRAIAPMGFEDIAAEGEEFALVMIRREGGEVVVLGEVTDLSLVEKVAKKLVA